ncbi:MAG: ABC transporter permease, partial [Sphingomonadales bacterium]|nr:ABC transporter permease [Sphingomonadales bacterium]
VGLVVSRLAGSVRQPSRLRLAPTVHQIEVVGLKALPVIGLMSFLIGAVIVNQSAVQLRKFGAEVFVVDMLAISVLRELGILLAAILVAGRSGSAFTAEIGSMVLHEEVDAMKTIGMHPIDVLVLPRLVALVLVMPLIAFASDILGVLGGGLIAWATLDISPGLFLDQFQAAIVTSTFLVGIIKAPFFGAVVALSGCYEGLSVKRSAESVGRHTTLAVVQAIFFVIVLDALFSMFFTTMDW